MTRTFPGMPNHNTRHNTRTGLRSHPRALSRALLVLAVNGSLSWFAAQRMMPAGQLQALNLSLTLITISVLWPAPSGRQTSSANTGVRYFGGLALALNAALASHLPVIAPWAGLFGASLLLLAMLLHRLTAQSRPAVTWDAAAAVIRSGHGRYGRFTSTQVTVGSERALHLRGPDAQFLAVRRTVRPLPGGLPGTWEVDLPVPQPGQQGDFLAAARRLGANPVVLAARTDAFQGAAAETLLHLPYTVLFGTPEEQFERLEELRQMAGALRQPQEQNAREAGRELEARAIQAVLLLLPANWQMRHNVALFKGGDADLELTAPDGQVYVIDIKLRQDNPAAADTGTHKKTWADLSAQVSLAARQLTGRPVLWQQNAAAGIRYAPGNIPVIGGPAEGLLSLLITLS